MIAKLHLKLQNYYTSSFLPGSFLCRLSSHLFHYQLSLSCARSQGSVRGSLPSISSASSLPPRYLLSTSFSTLLNFTSATICSYSCCSIYLLSIALTTLVGKLLFGSFGAVQLCSALFFVLCAIL